MEKITVLRYNNNYNDIWNRFVSSAKNGIFLFNRNYMDYHGDRFTDHSLMFFRGEEVVALLPANEVGNTLVSHGGLTYGGLLIDSKVKQHTVNDCVAALKDYSAANGFNNFIYKAIPHIFHQQPAEEDLYALFQNGARLIEVTASSVLNLKAPLKMPKGRKAQISRAKREGVEIKKLKDKEDFNRFILLENEVLETYHGVHAVHTAEEMFLLYSRFSQNIHLYCAMKEEEMIAGAIIYEYEEAVHTQYMASSEIGRRVGALDLVIATIIDDYKDSKLWLDFGGCTEEHGRVLNEGLISQKEGFGARTNICTVWELSVI